MLIQVKRWSYKAYSTALLNDSIGDNVLLGYDSLQLYALYATGFQWATWLDVNSESP